MTPDVDSVDQYQQLEIQMTNPHPDSTPQPATSSGPATLVQDTDEDLDFELPLRTETEIGEAADEFFDRVGRPPPSLTGEETVRELQQPPEDIRQKTRKPPTESWIVMATRTLDPTVTLSGA